MNTYQSVPLNSGSGAKPALLGLALTLSAAIHSMNAEASSSSNIGTNQHQLATLGGGCFWCTEAVFERLPGVKSVVSGYAGGTVEDPTYKQVCSGRTGHAEVVQIEFDPLLVSYEKLLEVFWHTHDPTALNRQGPDVGTQYRSVIFYHDLSQKTAAENSRKAAAAQFKDTIVTEIVPLTKFYLAEAEHQDFFRRNPDNAYCAYWIPPKLKKLENLKKNERK